MSKKKIASKLTDSLRQARENPAAPAASEAREPAPPPARTQAAPEPQAPTRSQPRAEPPQHKPAAPARRSSFASQNDQSPAASLDRPWENLHPGRIWPD